MSKTLNGAIAHTQNNAFVSPYFEQSSPLGACLNAVTDDCSLDALETVKADYQTFLNQIADTLDVIAERENLAQKCPPHVSYSEAGNVASSIDLMASLVRLSADMGLAIDQRISQKMEDKQ